ncbi:hypothetical protein Syun_027751 [Stephania yunnanensis]|uniref:DUF4283 domain-containing protein n=1 Tax=Stephania yunnanensis TaxID=152371 RepID=A0AAP0EIJ7_9MAGN
MENHLGNPVLSDDENEELIVEPVQGTLPDQSSKMCLLGHFLMERSIHFITMKIKLAAIWHPRRGLSVVECPTNRYIFQFYHLRDMGNVIKGGPWPFNRYLLILKELDEGVIPRHVNLDEVMICVQVYDIPVRFMFESLGKQLGNFIGKFVEFDCANNKGSWRNYMHV